MPQAKCPRCGVLFDSAETPAMPFCSVRCQQLDLRRWLREDYSVPVTRPREDEPSEAEGEE